MNDDELDLDYDAINAAAYPIIDAAIEAELRGDHQGACRLIDELYRQEPIVALAGMLRLGAVAALRYKPGPGAPQGFVPAFTAAAAASDRDTQRDLYFALLEPACGIGAPPEAKQAVHDTSHDLLLAACAGLRREAAAQEAAEHRKHQHPRARSGSRPRRRHH